MPIKKGREIIIPMDKSVLETGNISAFLLYLTKFKAFIYAKHYNFAVQINSQKELQMRQTTIVTRIR